MGRSKPKHTRADAERLFGGLAPTGTRSASSPINPFDDGYDVVERSKNEPTIWSKETVWLPTEIEVPPGYKTVAEVREAMSHAWGMTWISETREGMMARLADGWEVVHQEAGGAKIYDGNAFRAEWASGEHAKLRLLCRYRIESKSTHRTIGVSSSFAMVRSTGSRSNSRRMRRRAGRGIPSGRNGGRGSIGNIRGMKIHSNSGLCAYEGVDEQEKAELVRCPCVVRYPEIHWCGGL